MTEYRTRWAVLQPQQRAILPWRRCAITGERIGFGERFNEALQVRVSGGGWQIMTTKANQYISQQGQAVLVLQGNEVIEEVPVFVGGKKII